MSNEHPAITVLNDFINAMNKWERDCQRRSRPGPKTQEEWQERYATDMGELRRIFASFTTIKGDPPRGVTYQGPPEYDTSAEKITEVNEKNGKCVFIHTYQKRSFETLLVYELVLVEKEWRIKNRWEIEEGKKKKINL